MTDQQQVFRKTRFVCISDTHNASPGGAFKLPPGDVLIHAGDLTNQGSYSELQKTIKWIEGADFEAKIVVAGNHDVTLDSDFYAQYGPYFHNQNPQSSSQCRELLDSSPSILWLKDESAIVDLVSPTGPRTTFKVFGSPSSPENGMWAFGYKPDQATQIWSKIPLDADIVITHTPPKYHCDERKDRRAAGCERLREALWRVRPRLHICGHVHEGRGVDRILWDLDAANIKYKESRVEHWEDPGRGNNKLSLLDLTSKGGKSLRNFQGLEPPYPRTPEDPLNLHFSVAPADLDRDHVNSDLIALPVDEIPLATQGQGGTPPSYRCDLEALSGRMGRQETCVVNAAVMASSWPHGLGGKKFNKPIVIDIDLPTWDK